MSLADVSLMNPIEKDAWLHEYLKQLITCVRSNRGLWMDEPESENVQTSRLWNDVQQTMQRQYGDETIQVSHLKKTWSSLYWAHQTNLPPSTESHLDLAMDLAFLPQKLRYNHTALLVTHSKPLIIQCFLNAMFTTCIMLSLSSTQSICTIEYLGIATFLCLLFKIAANCYREFCFYERHFFSSMVPSTISIWSVVFCLVVYRLCMKALVFDHQEIVESKAYHTLVSITVEILILIHSIGQLSGIFQAMEIYARKPMPVDAITATIIQGTDFVLMSLTIGFFVFSLHALILPCWALTNLLFILYGVLSHDYTTKGKFIAQMYGTSYDISLFLVEYRQYHFD